MLRGNTRIRSLALEARRRATNGTLKKAMMTFLGFKAKIAHGKGRKHFGKGGKTNVSVLFIYLFFKISIVLFSFKDVPSHVLITLSYFIFFNIETAREGGQEENEGTQMSCIFPLVPRTQMDCAIKKTFFYLYFILLG